MSIVKRLLYAKIVFIISIVLSFLSIISVKITHPFFSWKLYSQPLGTHGYFEEYRIYSKMKENDVFHRNSVRDIPTFTTDEYVYAINYFVNQTLTNPNEYKWRLQVLCKHLVPNADEYKIVLETYCPSDLYSKSNQNKYDTTTVVSF
ncbi:MAG: hypothetical protein EAZ07_05145 [Cytophagales bacterium]|nr:MAG: hypothetical protein EAZ07_05145 [Cytophagales bacterium]